MKQTATITVKQEKNVTIIINDKGAEWKFPYEDPLAAIAFLVFFTMYNNFNMLENYKDDFSMEITMTVK